MTPERYEQIGNLYQAALEREPMERAAFLAEACGADEVLRHEVASLLAAHEQAEGFIEEPPDDIAAGWQVAAARLPEQRLSHYRLLSLLGKGGMGEVWLAEDTQLGRKVAVKLLPAEFTTDADRVRRFAQEARAASALNHPNIITIHEIGEAPAEAGGTHYLVTEFVDGQTLRQRLQSGPFKLPEALNLLVQAASALAAAHEAGIIHRDIKPENVMVRRDGLVKVLDFGLAKLSEPLAPAADTHAPTRAAADTETGVVLGTPRYMSPEQARGERLDARTDIFSFGVLLYELIAGRAPFTGATLGELLAAILRDEPPPLAQTAPGTPPELARIVGKTLRKDRAERYQTASELLTDLTALKQGLELGTRQGRMPSATRGRLAIFTATALCIAMLAGLAGWAYFNRPPALSEKDTILLADFENKTGEAIFDQMLKQGLAIQLQQSPFLHLLPEAQVRDELKLMKRSPNERVTAELAREICERQNLKALIAGSLAPLGSHYVITLEALNGQSGATLARAQVEAANREQILRALSQVATQLREKLGESLSSIQQSDRPLEEATTANLEAFQFYAQGIQQALRGKTREAIPALRRAVEFDPNFAFAWGMLAMMQHGTGQLALAAECAEKAYTLRERTSAREQMRITYFYHRFVTGDVPKQIETLLLQQRMFPGELDRGQIDLAITYHQLGQSEQASAAARESMRLLPNFAQSYRLLAAALFRLNRFAEAREVIEQALRLGLEVPDFHALLFQLACIQSAGGDTAEMQRQLDQARKKSDEYVVFDWQAQAAAFRGQWRQAQDFSQRAIDLARRGDAKEVAARYATEQALRSAVFGACRQARVDAAQGLKFARGRAALPRAALALALCGETPQAKPLLDELTRLYPEDTLINSLWLPVIRAALALQRGNAAQALEQLQAASRYEAAAEFWPQYLRGQAHLQLGRGAEAEAEFQKILAQRGQAPLSTLYPLAQLGLARAAARASEAAASRRAYQDFFTLWKEADAELLPLRAAKREVGELAQ